MCKHCQTYVLVSLKLHPVLQIDAKAQIFLNLQYFLQKIIFFCLPFAHIYPLKTKAQVCKVNLLSLFKILLIDCGICFLIIISTPVISHTLQTGDSISKLKIYHMSFFVYGGNVEAEQLTCSTDFKSVGSGGIHGHR